jgi:integrase
VTIRRSKTDQEGAGTVKAIPLATDPNMCPVRALRAWLELAAIEAGSVFRTVDRWGHVAEGRLSDRGVARAVQRAAEAAGLDASRFAGHSLRAGFATSAILAGKAEADVMRQTGHRSVAVFRGYVRIADAWRSNAASGLL